MPDLKDLNEQLVRAIMGHFTEGASTCGLPIFPEGSLKNEDAYTKWLEIRISDMSKKLISQQLIVDLAVNVLCCVRSSTTSAKGSSIYDIEGIIGCIESMFTPIHVLGVGCLDFPQEPILGLQSGRPREVKPGLMKAEITGFYRLEVA